MISDNYLEEILVNYHIWVKVDEKSSNQGGQ